ENCDVKESTIALIHLGFCYQRLFGLTINSGYKNKSKSCFDVAQKNLVFLGDSDQDYFFREISSGRKILEILGATLTEENKVVKKKRATSRFVADDCPDLRGRCLEDFE
ncbi:MAG: hypothetical protein Q7K43_02880, partial [Candidatus Woesearchaeota archaeon]|nr:hypothetical protein [Candidatus Woesearchaeota archaeon]